MPIEIEQTIKKYKIWFNIFLIVGAIGMLDSIVTGTLIEINSLQSGWLGIMSLSIGKGVGALFGEGIGVLLAMPLNLILKGSFIWFIIAYIIHRKIKKLNKITQNQSV